MANPLQQRALQRKVIYLALILALFTGSLLHRKLVLERQAEKLQLRETARGEVALTSSFVRLSLTGSRGLATTILWSTALDRMMRHEWNELELVVNSISALQPYFVTPWLFQSWNLAFNVAVECDRPRDKYYYVSRGLELLAEGERRNQGTAEEAKSVPGLPIFPGHPEMRHYVGFYYQLKIGNSDEKSTMRSLLEMSCIDPLKRNPEKFYLAGGREIDREKLLRFCNDHPRLVRRLRENLGYEEPAQIVKFLEANKDVPTRFKKALPGQDMSDVEEPRKQFPVLPPVSPRPRRSDTGPAWPDPTTYDLTNTETLNVFLFCRTWYQYAQEPLPPANAFPGVDQKEREFALQLERERKEKNINYRLPRAMATPIFRGYPARGQLYIAETLEAEGWFDEDGWVIKGWFDAGSGDELRVGVAPKYHAAPQWQEAHRMYLEYGQKNGLYMTPAELAELEGKGAAIRAKYKLERATDMPPPMRPVGEPELAASFDAQQKLGGSIRDRAMCNYDAHLFQTEAEMDPQAVLGRKLLFHAVRYNQKNQHEAVPLYEQAWPVWIEVAMRYPNFLGVGYVQEDLYEPMLRYMNLSQKENAKVFRSVMMGMAQSSVWPHPDWEKWQWIDPAQLQKVVSVRVARGPLEMVAYYQGPDTPTTRAVRDYWFGMTHMASCLGTAGFVPPIPLPEQANFALVGAIWERHNPPPSGLRYFIDPHVVRSVRERLGLIKPQEVALPTGSPEAVPLPR